MEKINKILDKTLKTKGVKKIFYEEMTLLLWQEIAGPQISLKTEISHIKNGVLFVKVSNSMWSQQLSFLKHTLINKLNHRLGRAVVKEMIFILGFTEKSSELEVIEYAPGPESFSLNEDERKKIEEITGIIKESDLREKLKNIMINEARSAKWKKMMGWIECTECKALFLPKSREIKCPLCALKK